MRIFVYEHLSVTVGRTLAASLRAEGRAMLAAITADLSRLPGVEVQTLLAADEESAFRRLARWADWSLVIAPEFERLLETRCLWVEEDGGRLLGPSTQAVQLTADKLALAEHLSGHGMRTPSSALLSSASVLVYPTVCKPRYGAGSQATFLVHDAVSLEACREQARREEWTSELIVQPFAPGIAASVAFLIGPRQLLPLAPAAQLLSDEGRFGYRGGVLPLSANLAARAVRVARPAVECVPGLLGYVGVDVVLGDAEDGSCDWVIEINPRLTTSYLGLRALAETNLAEAMLHIVQGEEATHLRWRTGTIRFGAEGVSPALTSPER